MYVEEGGFLVFLPATFSHLIKIRTMGFKQKCCVVFLGCFPNRKRAYPYPCTSFFLLPIKLFCLLEFWIFWLIIEKVNKDFPPNELALGLIIQPLPMLKWQTKDKSFSLRNCVAFTCLSLTFALDVGDSLQQGRCIGVSTQTFKLMALSYSLRVNWQKPDYFALDRVLQDTTFNITASLYFFCHRKTWEKN